MNAESLRLLIISDLHAHGSDPMDGSSPSYYSTNIMYSSPDNNPLKGIVELTRESGLHVDLVITPGDLGDRADFNAQKLGWSDLEEIRKGLHASDLIGTAGNHDLDSRRVYADFDPKSALQLLHPFFPLRRAVPDKGDLTYCDRFWSRNYIIVPIPEADCTMLILNSCAFHGYASDSEKNSAEHLRGRISKLTLASIRDEIAGQATKINIALFHHHLTKSPWIDDAGSEMIGGDKLIELLKETDKQWLVLHGHRHLPNLSYADGSSLSPIVLSAGSVAARTYEVQGKHPRNQIHHITIPTSDLDVSGAELKGVVQSWTWSAGVGWAKAKVDGGLPAITGFGYRPQLVSLRKQLQIMTEKTANGVLPWGVALKGIPDLRYLTPDDMTRTLSLLRGTGMTVEMSEFGVPSQLEISQ